MPPDLHDPDRELVQLCLAGEPGAWSELVGRYGPELQRRLQSAAARRGIPLPPADAEDLVSKVWEDLLRDDRRLLEERPPEAPLSHWLYAVAIHRLLPRARSQARETRRLKALIATLPRDASTSDPDAAAQGREREARVQAAVARLAPRERFAVGVFYGSGWSHARIARVLRMPARNVGSLLRTALTHLREFLRRPENLAL